MHYDDIVTTIRVTKITFHQALLMRACPKQSEAVKITTGGMVFLQAATTIAGIIISIGEDCAGAIMAIMAIMASPITVTTRTIASNAAIIAIGQGTLIQSAAPACERNSTISNRDSLSPLRISFLDEI